MNNKISDSNLLASLAVFRQLQESGKSINDILNEFIVDIIKTNGLHSFTSKEVNNLLNETYDFQIPEAVVRLSLKKIDALTHTKGMFTINDSSKLKEFNIEEQKNSNTEKHMLLISQLYEYIELKNNKKLSDKDKNDVEHTLSNFILDNRVDNKYLEFISAFIIQNKNNPEFISTWDTIREGVVLYTGLKYNPNLQTSWNTNLTIYLNIEIIFHFAGYDGTLYKTLIHDLYSLIKEINAKRKYIHLKYLPETKKEIDSFFYAAENIVKKGSHVNQTSSAMIDITKGSKSLIDILIKKESLFSLLATSGILEENREDIYGEENHKFNIATSTLFDKYQEIKNIENIENIINKLNYISIKRGETEQNNFENIGYILLSEARNINLVTWDETVKERGQVPLSTNMQFLTNKFWFQLNKGFGKKDYPISFKITTKAQILLSSHLAENIKNSYVELQQQLKNGTITEEIALKILCELKTRSKLPEQLQDENMNDVLSFLEVSTLDDYLLEHENDKQVALEYKNEAKLYEEKYLFEQKEKLSLVNDYILAHENEKQIGLEYKSQAESYEEKYLFEQKEKLSLIKDSLFEQEEKLSFLIQKKTKSEKTLKIILDILDILRFLVVAIFIIIVIKFMMDSAITGLIQNIYAGITVVVSTVIPVLVLFYGNKIEFIEKIISKIRNFIQLKLYKYYGFQEESYEKLNIKIKSLLDSKNKI